MSTGNPQERRARPRVVIVGGGFGGLQAALGLRSAPVDVTIVDRHNYHLFQPLLYQVATAVLAPGDIAYPIRAVVRRQKNTKVLLAEAVSIDVPAHEVVLDHGRLGYDRLILAPGSRHSYFGHADWEQAAPGLKTIEDALEIRRRLLLAFETAERTEDPAQKRAQLTFVIVGGGPTGVELAGAVVEIARHTLAEDFRTFDPRSTRVLLVEAGPRILSAFPETLSGSAQDQLRRLGVEVRTKSLVKTIDPRRGVYIADPSDPARPPEWIDTHNVLWAAGVEASSLARSLGVSLDRVGRVCVAPDLSVPGHPEIAVIGDLAAFTHQTGSALPGVAPVAIQQGRAAAANIVRWVRGEPLRPFHYRDKGSLATIGRAAAVADFGWLRLSGFFAWVAWGLVHILFLIGFRNRLMVMLEWFWAYLTGQSGSRLITWGEPAPDVRTPEKEDRPAVPSS